MNEQLAEVKQELANIQDQEQQAIQIKNKIERQMKDLDISASGPASAEIK